MAADELNKKRQEFEDTQLDALNVQTDLDSEAVLQQAKTIGLITDKVLQKIEESGVKDKLAKSFKVAKDKAEKGLGTIENDSQKRMAKAFRIAFKNVYGRFLMEGENVSVSENSQLFEKLKGILKFDLDEHGLKGRPELQAAAGRLRTYLYSRWPSVKPAKIAEAKAEKTTLTKKRDVAETHLNGLGGLTGIADSVKDPIDDYKAVYASNPESDEFKAVNNEIGEIEKEINAANLEIDEIKEEIDEVEEEIGEIEKEIASENTEVNTIKAEFTAIDKEIDKIKTEISSIDREIGGLGVKSTLAKFLITIRGVSESELFAFFSALEVNPEVNPSALTDDSNPNLVLLNILSLTPEKLNLLFEKVSTDQLFARKIFGIPAGKVLDRKDFTSRLRYLRSIFHTDKFEVSDTRHKSAEAMFKLIGAAEDTLNKSIKKGDVQPIADHFAEHDAIKNEIVAKKVKKNKLVAKLKEIENYRDDELGDRLRKSKEIRDSELRYKLRERENYRDNELAGQLKQKEDSRDAEWGDRLRKSKETRDSEMSSSFKEGERMREAEFTRIADIFDSFNKELNKTKDDPDVSSTVKDLCNKYIALYEAWRNDGDRKNPVVLGTFYNKTFKTFIQDLRNSLTADVKGFGDNVTALDFKIDQLERDLIPSSEADDILEKAFPKAKSGAEMEGLKRKHHEAEHKEHELQDVYKYFSSHDSFTNVVEGGSQLSAAIKDWKDEQTKSVETIEAELNALGSGKADERAKLEKKKNKAGLPLNARIAYLEEQIALKKQSTLSNEAIEKTLNERAKRNDKDFKREDERDRMEKENERKAEELGVLKDEHKRLTLIASKAKEFRDELTKLVIKAVKAEHLGIDIKSHVGASEATHNNDKHGGEHHGHHGIAAEISGLLQKMNLDNGNFDPQNLINLYGKFNGLFADGDKVQKLLEDFDAASAEKAKATKDTKKDLDKATAALEKGKNLTDDQAAKRIIGAMVGEQFSDLSPTDHNKLVSMILADDVATLQTDEGYEALAQRGSAEKLETLKFAGFRAKLLNFKFKEGEKITQPFKGLKPDDFKDWASMEKLFLSGKLNYKNAFFVLAAFEEFDNGVKSIQSVQLEKKLKKLLAKQMGVDEHMDKAGLSKIVDDAFKAQMEKVRPIMKAHSETVDSKGGKAKEHKKKVLDMKYEELNDQLRTKKIGHEVYEHKLEALVKEASESDVAVEFSADSVGAQLWNSPEAQWLKDKAYDTRTFLGKKALAVGVIAPFKIGMSGLWGGTKLGASLGFQAAMMPFRAAKYPLLLAAKPVVGSINLFRSNKWTPLPGIRDSIKNDAGRVLGYTTEKATGVVKGATETVTKTAGGEWGKVKFADIKYADRNKHHADERAEMLKVHEPKSDIDPIEVAESPFINFDKYNKQIEMVTKALGITIHAPTGHEVKVGHEEKVAEKKEAADHAKPEAAHDAHEKKPEAAHGHH